MASLRYAVSGLIAVLLLVNTNSGLASPWTNTQDVRLRLALQQLNDSGVTNIPMTSWPIHWANVERSLKSPNIDKTARDLSQSVQTSLRYVHAELAKTRKIPSRSLKENTQIGLALGSTTGLFKSYGDNSNQQQDATIEASTHWQNDTVAIGINVQYLSNAEDHKRFRLDGSYVAMTIDNWGLSLGATNRWWGPGWQSSLILSNNARPIPAITLSRIVSHAPQSAWFSWIGPWHFSSFLGQLEGSRFIPEAKLLGLRFSFKPLLSLELGFSRAAQWGGVGRPESLVELGKVLIGKDENVIGGEGPGNQLGGFDARYSWAMNTLAMAGYGQLIGEDEAGLLPSKYIYLVGLEVFGIAIDHNFLGLFLEYSDTMSGRIVQNERPNVAYGHSVYQSGYRYNNRAIGSTYDNDSRSVTLGGVLTNKAGSVWTASISQLDLNTDNVASSNQVSKTHHKLQHVSINWEADILKARLNLLMTTRYYK